MKINRREAIAAGVGLLMSGVSTIVDTSDAAGGALDPPGECARMCREEPARFCAEWELTALRSNCPNTWQTWRYCTGVQWDKTRFIIFGVGPAPHVEAEFARHCESWEKRELLQAHITEDSRAWALLIEGRLSDDLREELRQGGPSFSSVHERRYLEVETDLDEELDAMMAEREATL
jgi:hypothetical protein